MLIHNVKVRN